MTACLSLAGILAGGAHGGTVTWTGGSGNWSDPAKWSPASEPAADDDVVIDNTAGTITLGTGEAANSLTVGDNTYTLDSGSITLGNPGQAVAGKIQVHTGRVFTVNSILRGSSGITKTGDGTLTLGGTNLVTGGITISGGTVTLAATAAGDLALGNNAINVSGAGNLNLCGGIRYLREFSGAGTIWAGYTDTQVLNALNDATFNGTITNSWTPRIEFADIVKTGPGSQTIDAIVKSYYQYDGLDLWRGTLAYAGANGRVADSVAEGVNMRGATLTLDDSAGDIDRLEDTTPIGVYGGGSTLRYIGGPGTASAEILGTLASGNHSYSPGAAGNVDVRPGGAGGSATVTFAAFSPMNGQGSWSDTPMGWNFTTSGTGTLGSDAKVLFTTAPAGSALFVNNVLACSFANGSDIATYDVTKGVVPFNAVGEGGVAYVAAASAGATDTAYLDAGYDLTTGKTWTALRIHGPTTLDMNDNNLTIGASGLPAMVLKSGAGEAVIANSTGAQKLTGAQQNFVIRVDEGTLTITAPMDGNGTYKRYVKSGPGLLWLDPSAVSAGGAYGNYHQGIFIGDGAVRLDPTSTRINGNTYTLNGGVLEMTHGHVPAAIGQNSGNVCWQSSGGFAAYGTNATFSPNITWNAANHIPDGAALLLNSTTADKKITLSGTLNLGTDAAKMYLREFYVYDNTNSATDLAEIRGQIISDTDPDGGGTPTLTYHLVKTGTGTLILSHTNNSYNGATHIKAGLLTLSGNAVNSPVEVLSEGTLKLSAAGAAHGVAGLKMEPGATVMTELSGGNAGRLSVSGRVELNNATLSVAGAPRPGGTSTFTLIDNDGSDAVAGIFSGAPERAMVTTDGRPMRISYVGGDGNDVTLQVPRGTVVVVF